MLGFLTCPHRLTSFNTRFQADGVVLWKVTDPQEVELLWRKWTIEGRPFSLPHFLLSPVGQADLSFCCHTCPSMVMICLKSVRISPSSLKLLLLGYLITAMRKVMSTVTVWIFPKVGLGIDPQYNLNKMLIIEQAMARDYMGDHGFPT